MNLGYLLILAQKEHRGIHDLLADTSVIYYHEKKVYVHTQMNYRNMVPQPGYIVPQQGGINQQNGNSLPQQSDINPQSGDQVSSQEMTSAAAPVQSPPQKPEDHTNVD